MADNKKRPGLFAKLFEKNDQKKKDSCCCCGSFEIEEIEDTEGRDKEEGTELP
ncbi:MAG: hypothetical protein GXZ00_06390 [Synergistaceae bacterium]|nr:hypothetical protein [Synergistaceae bacterium]